MAVIRIIGDVHQKLGTYIYLAEQADYTVQLGDLAVEPGKCRTIPAHLDPKFHKFIRGNHDNYDVDIPNDLGDFGMEYIGGFHFFYVRGAKSQTSLHAVPPIMGVDWWPDREELNYHEANAAIQLYSEAKPDIVLAHECPDSVKDYFLNWPGDPTFTGKMLQTMLEIHRPKLWLFGHYHKDRRIEKEGTIFQCLPELAYIDFDYATGKPLPTI